MKAWSLMIVLLLIGFNAFCQSTIAWQQVVGGLDNEGAASLIQTSEGKLLFGGWSQSDSSGNKTVSNRGLVDYWVIKTNLQGNIVWQQAYGGSNSDVLSTILETNDGYLIGGHSKS